jgi:hypothetical protein
MKIGFVTRRLALAAHIPGAQSIPTHAEVVLGFTTTLQSNLGPGIIANLETLPGVTDQWPHGYFKQGTTMQLSRSPSFWSERVFPTTRSTIRRNSAKVMENVEIGG